MEKKHYFAGFRREIRDKLAKSIGVEAEAIKYKEVRSKLDNHVYVRSIFYLKWNPIEFLEALDTCIENRTKFVSIDDGFCFDGSAKNKQLRHTSLMACKQPEIGQAMYSVLKNIESSQWHTAFETRRLRQILRVLTDYVGLTMEINPVNIARLLNLDPDKVQEFIESYQSELAERQEKKNNRELRSDS